MCNQLTTALHSHSQPASNEQHTHRGEYKHKKVKSHISNEFYFLLNLFKSSLISFHGNERPNIPFTGNFSSLLLLFKNQSLFSNGSKFFQVSFCASENSEHLGVLKQTTSQYDEEIGRYLRPNSNTLSSNCF